MATPEERIAEIDKEFGGRLAAAAEADRPALTLEREQAKNGVWADYRQSQRRAEWVATVLTEFPRAPHAAIQGATLDEIRASAKGLHDHYDAEVKKTEAEIRERLEKEAAQKLYGQRPQGGGGNQGGSGDGGAGGQGAHPFDQLTSRITEIATAHKEGRGIGAVQGPEHDRFIQAIGDTLIQRQIFGQLPDGREPQKPA